MSFYSVGAPAASFPYTLEFEELDEPQEENAVALDSVNSDAGMSPERSPASPTCEDSNELEVELNEPGGMLFEERFDRLLRGNIKTDCKFVVGTQKDVVEGHKLIFSIASEAFYAMFYGQLKEDSIVVIEDLQLDGFEGMKQFIYTGIANFTSVLHACSVFVAARKYLISKLREECITYMKNQEILPSEVLQLYEYCKNNEIPEIEEKCSLVMQNKTREVVDSEYFLSANSGTMDTLLRFESLNLESEQELFNHLERWAVAEAERRDICKNDISSYFNKLKKGIRFLTMDGEKFTSGPAKSLLLTQEEKLAILLNIMDYNSTPLPDFIDESCRKKRKFVPLNSQKSSPTVAIRKNFFDQEKFKSLLTGSIVSDCEFIVGPQQNIVKGHKLIFSMASKVFQKIFLKQLKEDSVLKINDLELDAFEGMKHFIYTGDICFSSEIQACSTYIASQKYSIPQLGEKCINYLKNRDISTSDVLKLYEFCRDNKITSIVEKCIQIIQEKTSSVVKSEYFFLVDIDTIDMIMSFQKLHLKSEMEVFRHFEGWALAEAKRIGLSDDRIASNFNNLKKHIRFLTMKPKEFAKGPALSPLLTQEEKLNIGLNIMDLSSAPYPENLSLSQQERCFTFTEHDTFEKKQFFDISLSQLCDLSMLPLNIEFSSFDCNFEIEVFKFGDNICFRLNAVECHGEYLIDLKTKLRVLATDENYNDLVFEEKGYLTFYESDNTDEGDRIDTVLAVIPWDKVDRACFIQNDGGDLIKIEGLFTLQLLLKI